MAKPFTNTVKFLPAINLLASPSGATVRRLMDQLNISRRTAFKLLDALEELGLPLVDKQPKSRGEKTYRLLDSYVLKLPNLAIPNPGFIATEMLLSMLDFCINMQQSGGLFYDRNFITSGN
jgi:predicted DNA-binding transcriptional regulator YafY